VYWEEHANKEVPLSFDVEPFFIVGSQIQEWCFGPDRNRAKKQSKKDQGWYM